MNHKGYDIVSLFKIRLLKQPFILMDLSINENYKKLLGYGLQTKLKIFKRLKYQLN